MSTVPAATHANNDAFRTIRTESPPNPTSVQFRSQTKPHPSSSTTPIPPKVSAQTAQQKKASRRSSKPIINWFQRKLAGSGKAKRADNVPCSIVDPGLGRIGSGPNRHIGRITSSPLPIPAINYKQQGKIDAASVTRRKTRSISLNGDESIREFNQLYADDDLSLDQSSLNRESIWSPASALEADDDASVRPIPPSGPPSPSPSRSSSSYLSDPRTFRSIAPSTKPTTLLSIDLNGNGMAHIAQVPPINPVPTQLHRFPPHVRQSSLSNAGLLGSGGSITFSALPSTQPTSRPTSSRNPGSINSLNLITQQQSPHPTGQVPSVQAPLHTTHHPRNNPRPSSPPLDNASLLTLASSAFGLPNRTSAQGYTPSAIGDTVSHYGGSITFPDAESTSQSVLGDDDRLEERDVDASVRALRPRSSRRGSWESEASRWSARIQGTSLVRERSLWTSNSIRTGGVSLENGEIYETADDQLDDEILKKGGGVAVEGVIITVEEHGPTHPRDDPTSEPQKLGISDPTPEISPLQDNSEVSRSSTDTIALVDQLSEGQPKAAESPHSSL